MRRFLALTLVLAAQGCSYYSERFAFTNRQGDTNVVFRPVSFKVSTNDFMRAWSTNDVAVDQEDKTPRLYVAHVKFWTFFQWGKANRLQTLTKTREFVRTVNGEGLETGVDAEAIEAMSKGVTKAALEYFNPLQP